MDKPVVLPSGPIIRSRVKKYGATMSLCIQEQVTQELHDLALNKCCVELKGTPKFLTLIEAYAEERSTPVLVDTPRLIERLLSSNCIKNQGFRVTDCLKLVVARLTDDHASRANMAPLAGRG
ncbi:hypothetical protein JCGZ_17106 [Jatropha curcas]|uniref:Uncharacterized protein n=1 Tax=Jatropha curcas TaxID=180498 RepID=A0A067K2M7_JATCU|nr:hypothetical protein JCGZ_17106 [Jatropha curcas]